MQHINLSVTQTQFLLFELFTCFVHVTNMSHTNAAGWVCVTILQLANTIKCGREMCVDYYREKRVCHIKQFANHCNMAQYEHNMWMTHGQHFPECSSWISLISLMNHKTQWQEWMAYERVSHWYWQTNCVSYVVTDPILLSVWTAEIIVNLIIIDCLPVAM